MGNFRCGVFLQFTGSCRVSAWPVLSQTVMQGPEPFVRKRIRAHSQLVAGGSSCFLPSRAQRAAGTGSLHTQLPALGIFLHILSLKSLLTFKWLKISEGDCSSEGLGFFSILKLQEGVVGSDKVKCQHSLVVAVVAGLKFPEPGCSGQLCGGRAHMSRIFPVALSLLWQGWTSSHTQPSEEPSAAMQRVWA